MGYDFRPEYKHAVKLRSIFDCPCLALSATVSQDVYSDIVQALQLEDAAVTAVLPDRPNIFLDVVSKNNHSVESDLMWLLNMLSTQQHACPKTLVFGHSINVVADVYSRMMTYLVVGHSAMG